MTDQRDKPFRSWAKLLDPEQLRSNLIRASIYLSAYEFLRQALTEHLEGFFADGFNADGPILGENYRSKVLSLHKMVFFASAIWFRDAGALTEQDLERIKEIREHRNFVAHHIPDILGDADADVRLDLLDTIAEIVRTIDVWWILEIDIPTNPNFDTMATDDINTHGIFSMRMAVLDLLRQVASGNDEGLGQLYEQFTQSGVA